MAETTLKDIMAYFSMTPKEMSVQWKAMSLKDKADIKNGLQDGSLTY